MNRFLNSPLSLATNYLRVRTSGIRKSLVILNARLRSLPQRDVLKLPTTTPSGLIIGMNLKTTFFLRYALSSDSVHRNSMSPLPMKLAQDYPGCILPETSMHFFFLLSTSGSVMVIKGISSPLRDSQSTSSLRMAA